MAIARGRLCYTFLIYSFKDDFSHWICCYNDDLFMKEMFSFFNYITYAFVAGCFMAPGYNFSLSGPLFDENSETAW